jgi:hypothetical protein
LIVWVVIFVAGEDLPPPPFFIIFCVHGGWGLRPCANYIFASAFFKPCPATNMASASVA